MSTSWFLSKSTRIVKGLKYLKKNTQKKRKYVSELLKVLDNFGETNVYEFTHEVTRDCKGNIQGNESRSCQMGEKTKNKIKVIGSECRRSADACITNPIYKSTQLIKTCLKLCKTLPGLSRNAYYLFFQTIIFFHQVTIFEAILPADESWSKMGKNNSRIRRIKGLQVTIDGRDANNRKEQVG